MSVIFTLFIGFARPAIFAFLESTADLPSDFEFVGPRQETFSVGP